MTDPQPDQGRRQRWLPFSEIVTKWSMWVAAFWSVIGAAVMVGSAYLYSNWDWRIGLLIFIMAASYALARAAKQPGTEQ